MTLQGGHLRLHCPVSTRTGRGGGVRGRVVEFSRQSRRRLCIRFASLDWNSYAADSVPMLFLTLSTPAEYWNQEKRVYKALRAFRVWLSSCDGFEGAIVKKERGEERGMLHYHLIIFGCSFINASSIRSVWSKALAFDGGGAVRCHIERVEDAQTVAKYLSKYLGKISGGPLSSSENVTRASRVASFEGDAPSGPLSLSKAHNGNPESVEDAFTGSRWWYCWGKLRECEPVEFVSDEGVDRFAARVRRIFRRWVMVQAQKRFRLSYSKRKSLFRAGLSALEVQNLADSKFFQAVKRGKFRWLFKSGGFSLLGSPLILTECIVAVMNRGENMENSSYVWQDSQV